MKKLLLIFVIMNSFNLFAERMLVQKHERYKTEDINIIKCLDSNYCLAFSELAEVTNDAKFLNHIFIYKSTDLGNTWNMINDVVYLPAKDSVWTFTKGFILDSNHFYFKFLERMIVDMTSDGGETFKRITFGEFSQDNLYSIDEIAMYDKNTGIILFNRGILTTKDGWDTYEHFPFENAAESSTDLEFLDSNNVLIQSGWLNNSFDIFNIPNQTRTRYSDPIESPPGEEKKRLYNVFQVTDSLFYATGGQYYGANSFGKDIIYRSTDRGRNWEIIYEYKKEKSNSATVLAFRNKYHGIASGSWGKFMETFDGGYTWNYYEDVPYGVENSVVTRVAFAGKYPLLATDGGGIYRVEEVNSVAESSGSSISIMPNPAGEYITLKIAESEIEDLTLNMYDINGGLIKTLDFKLSGGYQEFSIDVTEIPTGVYLYNLTNYNNKLSTGKFIIVK